MPIEGNPDPIEEAAKVIGEYRDRATTRDNPSDREIVEKIIKVYDEAKNPFVFGRFTKTADPMKDDYQLLICHDSTRQLIQGLLKQYGLELFQIPSTEEDGPLFGLRRKGV